jgi:hypothetical protein
MPTTKRIVSRREAVNVIRGLEDGRFFSVTFVKRTTGEVRIMTCRQRVKKYLAGGECAYSFSDKGLVSVFDIQKMAYRSIPIDGIRTIRVNDEDLEVDHSLVG